MLLFFTFWAIMYSGRRRTETVILLPRKGQTAMIRFITLALFLFSFLLLSIPLLIAEWIINKFNPRLRLKTSCAIVNWGFRVCLRISGTTKTVIGLENIPKDQPVLYVGNHRSYFDILLLSTTAPGPVGFLAKTEMDRYPLLNLWMRNIDCTFLDRSDIKQGMKVILKNIELLKGGTSISVFPEGTRNKTEELLLPFHDGCFKMAEKSKCPIVVITYNNTNAIFEDHIPAIKKQHVVMEFSKPIYLSDLPKEEKRNISSHIREIITETYNENKELV